jgi:predicted branched-subunit amino acid permease
MSGHMPVQTPRRALAAGLRMGLPFSLVVVPFGLVFGVAAIEAGFDTLQTGLFSLLVGAGAAQLAALQMIVEGAPLLIVVLTGTAVNLRLAMYSASLAPHLGAAPLRQRALAAFFLIDQVLLAQDDQSEAGRTGVHPCRGLDVLRDHRCVPSDQGEGVILAPAEPELGAQAPEGDEGDPG